MPILRRTDYGVRIFNVDGQVELVGVEVSDPPEKRRELEELGKRFLGRTFPVFA